ncbi:Double zinc ribbon [Anatilimnocola aggregata]|uniref:Double zinc ribbon n=1 Tax=Anatilimnocola aggregata TaxID=2528021 RepID=A0A517YB04_9BACT|nr:zinc ribbon domain-containing protein [Anatilimnocola aggregata]QDU27426.1 Double zinc ribbon [Anatilimnocola aggregata]
MTEVVEKCSVCQALLDEEDLFCANCGTEAPHRAANDGSATMQTTHNFRCDGCGASMSYDASVQTLRCPFCGGEKLHAERDAKSLAPKYVVPFQIEQSDAVSRLKEWMGSSFWRPGDLATAAIVTKLTAIYIPYWVFSGKTFTYWTADSSQTPWGANASWCPVSGEHRGEHHGLLVGASSSLSPAETHAICPYDLAQAVPTRQVDLENSLFEQFQVQRKYARPLAQQGLEERVRQACAELVPGNARNVHVNVRVEGLSADPVLLPVWIMAYTYQQQTFRFLLNGQTGRCTGTAPTSYKKIAAVTAAVIAAIILFIICAGLISAAGSQ